MKKERIPKLLQHLLSHFINQNIPTSTLGALTTITQVQITPNLTLAKIYLSFIPTHNTIDQSTFLKKIQTHNHSIKKYLAHNLRHKLRTIPNIQFHIDTTAQKSIQIQKILSTL